MAAELSRAKGLPLDLKRLTASVELKAGDGVPEGTVTAVIATLDVIDADGDVTHHGAFDPSDQLKISRWNHSSAWGPGDLPVGVGSVKEVGDKVIFEGQLNLDMEAGRELYAMLKFDQKHKAPSEWSYGYQVEESEEGSVDGQTVRHLKRLSAFEASPVMRGAGVDTQTVGVKSGQPLMEHAGEVESALSGLVERVKARAKARKADGRPLSEQNRRMLLGLVESTDALTLSVKAILEADEAPPDDVIGPDPMADYARMQATLALIGVDI